MTRSPEPDLCDEPDRRVALMARALDLAHEARNLGEVPVGALVVRSGRILAQAHNLRETLNDPTAHAERLALAWAGRSLSDMAARGLRPLRHSRAVRHVRRGDRPLPDQAIGLRRDRPQGRRLRQPLSAWSRTPGSTTGARSRRASWRESAAKCSKNSSRNAGHFVKCELARPKAPAGRCSIAASCRRRGGVPEWLKGPVSKTGVGASLPWVRIPPPPLRIEHVSALPLARFVADAHVQ